MVANRETINREHDKIVVSTALLNSIISMDSHVFNKIPNENILMEFPEMHKNYIGNISMKETFIGAKQKDNLDIVADNIIEDEYDSFD